MINDRPSNKKWLKLIDFAFPPPYMDFDNPYAIDMGEVASRYKEMRNFAAT